MKHNIMLIMLIVAIVIIGVLVAVIVYLLARFRSAYQNKNIIENNFT